MTDTSCYRVVSTGKNIQHLGENECKHYASLKGKSVSSGSFPADPSGCIVEPSGRIWYNRRPTTHDCGKGTYSCIRRTEACKKKERRFEVLKADCESAVDFVKARVIHGAVPATSHYGSVGYQVSDADFMPFGCQLYIDPNATNYNRVIYNSNTADHDNRPGVCATTSGSCSWGKGSSSYRVCRNEFDDYVLLTDPTKRCDSTHTCKKPQNSHFVTDSWFGGDSNPYWSKMWNGDKKGTCHKGNVQSIRDKHVPGDIYEYKYNHSRNTDNPVCPESSWCCRRDPCKWDCDDGYTASSPWESTGWPASGASAKAKCENGNMNNDGFEYRFNADRGTPNELCADASCCRRPKSTQCVKVPRRAVTKAECKEAADSIRQKVRGGAALSKAECKAFATTKGASYADTGMWAGGGSAGNKATAKKMAPGCLFWTDSGGKTVRYNAVGQGSCATPHFNYRCVRRSRETLLPVTKFYGGQPYKSTDAYDFLPYGCQMYLDPDSPDYNRVVFNNASACNLEVPKEKCLEYAKRQYGNRVVANRKELVVGNWGHVPSGCTVQSTGDMAAHYNEKPNIGQKSDYTKVMHPDCEPTHNKPGECATNASECSWGTRSSSFRVFKTSGGYVMGDNPEDHDVLTSEAYDIKKTETPAFNVTKEECRAFSEHFCEGNKNCAENTYFIEYSNSGFPKGCFVWRHPSQKNAHGRHEISWYFNNADTDQSCDSNSDILGCVEKQITPPN